MSDRDVTPPALPAHVRTIRIEAVEAIATGQEPLLRVRGVLEDRRPRGAPDWLAHDGDVIHRMERCCSRALPRSAPAPGPVKPIVARGPSAA